MFEGLFQPMHLLVIAWIGAADFRSQEVARAGQRAWRWDSRIQECDEC